MRVLHLISSGGMYGAEAVILGLLHGMRSAGDAGTVGVFSNASQQLHDRALAEGLSAVRIACASQFDRGTPAAIRAAVRETGADVVHSHGYKADLYALAALRSAGVPLVSTCHTWYDNDLALRVYGALDRWALRRYARVVAVSAEVDERLRQGGIPPERIRQIRNGVAVPDLPFRAHGADFSGRGEVAGHTPGDVPANATASESLHVGLVGRLAPEKGVDLFLRAAAQVHQALPGVRFTVFGEGPERANLEALRAELGLADAVALPGRSEAMGAAYAGLHLLVSASRQEGLPMALLEGMAAELPVVATAVGEVPLLVPASHAEDPNRETGLLVPPGDPEALAAAMLTVLGDPARLRRCGRNARAHIQQKFSVERMVAEYRAVYREALAEVGR